jgi:hypothetical protein
VFNSIQSRVDVAETLVHLGAQADDFGVEFVAQSLDYLVDVVRLTDEPSRRPYRNEQG